MLNKNELKYIQSLCQKKQRQEERLFLAEGTKLVEELLQSRFRIRKIYALTDWIEQHSDISNVVAVTETELQRISSLQTPNQVLAVVEQEESNEQPVFTSRLTLVLDGIQDPGNMGTIIRIADWFGIQQIIASEDSVELYNPKVIQSTMGGFLRVRVGYQSLPEVLASAKVPVYGALLDGKNMYQEQSAKEGILVIGNESKGISKKILTYITHPIKIPRLGGAESLNAAVATGIIVSHLTKP